MSGLSKLIEKISAEMDLTSTEVKELEGLVSAWEESLDTVAAIEPDGNYSEDEPLLKKLDKQEAQYDDIYARAQQCVREALGRYFAERHTYLE